MPKNGELLSLNSEVVPSSVFQENIQLYGGKYATDGGMQTLWRAADTIATLTIMLPQKPLIKFLYLKLVNNMLHLMVLQQKDLIGFKNIILKY